MSFKSSILSGVIVGVILLAIGFFLNLFSWAWEAVRGIWPWLITSTEVSNWLLILLALATLILIGMCGMIGFYALAVSDKPEAKYKEDMFHKVLWRWNYLGGYVSELTAFCPKCDMQLRPELITVQRPTGQSLGTSDETYFSCDDCTGFVASISFRPNDLEKNIRLKIEKNLRNGEWRHAVVKRQNEPRP